MNIRAAAHVTAAVGGRMFCAAVYLCVQHVYTEVTERCLEEVILGTVFQQGAVHCMRSHLEIT